MSNETMVGGAPFIKVIGVGGGGGNAVNHMYEEGINNVSFALCNTDYQDLKRSPVECKIQIGPETTNGLGCGAKPEVGRKAAEESRAEIEKLFEDNTKMVFITAGMGGGTGTGAAPVIAEIAKSKNILTIGIVTIPFRFEMGNKIQKALAGVAEMEKNVDALLVINNQRLIDLFGDLTISAAFKNADSILTESAKGIADIVTETGQINLDFADVSTVLKDSGVAIMNSGEAIGNNRIRDAIKEALTSPLLNNNDIRGAKRVLLYAYASHEYDISLPELKEIETFLSSIKDQSSDDLEFIWGMGYNDNLGDSVRVTIIATGFGLDKLTEDSNTDSAKAKDFYYDFYQSGNSEKTTEQAKTEPDTKSDIDTIDIDDWLNDDIDTAAYKK